jgi:hypothetical protein
MKAKLFVIVLAVLMMIGIAILRSRTIKKTLPIPLYDYKAPATIHELTVGKFEDWLASGGKSPNEQVVKKR